MRTYVFIKTLKCGTEIKNLQTSTNLIHSRWDSLDGGSARRKAVTYTQDNTNIHASNGIGTHALSVGAGDSSCLRPRGHCDRLLFMHYK
jgi:hypothetical protein